MYATPEVNWGVWVAACPRPGCNNAEHYAGPGRFGINGRHETGHLCGLTDSGFRCANCGWAGPVQWPTNRAAIESVLTARPVPDVRNWVPGETVIDLEAENMLHHVGVL